MYLRVNLKMKRPMLYCCFTWIAFIELNFTVAFLLIRKTWRDQSVGKVQGWVFWEMGGILLMGVWFWNEGGRGWYLFTDYGIVFSVHSLSLLKNLFYMVEKTIPISSRLMFNDLTKLIKILRKKFSVTSFISVEVGPILRLTILTPSELLSNITVQGSN